MSDAAPRDVPLPLPPGWLAKDVTWSRRLADKGKRRAWRWPAWLLARSGDSVFWLALSALALWQGQAMGWRLLWAMVTTAVIVFIVKGIFKRQRPSGHGRDFGADKYAFPSGHAARVTAIAVTLSFANLALTPVWLVWVTAVALARVILSRHYLTDVTGGVIVGLLIGLLLQTFL